MSRQHLRKNLVRAGVALLVLLVLLVLYAAAGFLLAPWLFQRNLPQYIEQKLEREVSVGNVRVNPFLLNMELSEVVIEGRHGQPVIAADRLFVDLGFRGLFSLTWMVDQLTLEGLRAHLVLEPDGTLNMLEMARRLSRDDPAAEQDLPALIVGEVSVPAASLVFTDLTGAQPASVALKPLSLQASGLSTLPEARGTHQLTTTLPGGGALEWRGELSLEPVLLASGQFQVRGLTAATLWPFVRDELLLSELQASANFSGRYAYDARASLQLEDVVIELSDVLLARPGAPEPMLAMQQIAATGGSFHLAQRAGSLVTLVFQSGHAVVAVAPDGSVNWGSLVAPAQQTAESAAAPAAEPAAETAAAPTTAAPAAEERTERTAGSRAATTAGEQNTAASSGLAAPTAPASPGWELDIGNLQLDQVALRYIDRARPQPLAVSIGQLNGQAQLSIAGGSVTQVVASGVDAGLQQISLAAEGASDAPVTLASAQVQQGHFDLLGKRLAAQQLSIEGGQAQVVRQQDGDIAVLDLLGVGQAKAGSSSGSSGSPADQDAAWRYDIAELRAESIDVALQDRSFTPAVGYSLQLQSLTASNVASASEAPTPFNATVNVQQGGTLQTSGTLTPEGGVQARIKVDQLALAPLRPVARRYTGLAVNSGPLSVSGSVRYAPTRQGRPNLTLDDVALTLPKVVVRRPGREQPLLALQRIDASGGRLDLASRDIVVARLALHDGKVRAATQAGGGLDWTVAKRGRGKRASPAPAPAAAAWNIDLNALRFDSVGAHYADRSRPTPLVVAVDSVSGAVKLAVTAGGARTQVVAQGLDAKFQQVAVGAGERAQPAVALVSGSIAQGYLNLVEQTVGAREIVLAGGGTKLVQTADGKIPLLSLFTPGEPAPARSQPTAGGEWRYDVGALRVDGFGITYADRGFEPPLSIDGTLQASVKDLARNKRSSFDATLALDPGGTIEATGTVAAGAKSAQAQVEANQVALTPLQPLLQRFAALTLESGALSASAQVRHEGGEAGAMEADGTVRITDLLMNEARSGDRFLAWKQLDADRVAFDLGARQLDVEEVTVRDPRAKIVISEDRSVNIAQVVKRDDKAAAGATADRAAAAQDAPDFAFSVGRVRLLQGEVDYADLSLVLPFSTKVTALNGTMVGISSDPSRRAAVEADGTIEPYGSAKVEGSIAMGDPRHFTDLHVEFNNVLVPPLSPYTATFAGRKVESGKLWLDLNYKVRDSELLGKNEIRLADFTLGEKVEAPNAMDFPLNLVVALLTDSKGVIHFSVPVRGDLDNPSFSVASAVKQALSNVLRRLVSAPFRALGRLFGRSTDSLASIDFQPGSAKIAPQEREKLDALVRALSERPRLKLVVSAPYDAQRDASVLQRELARRQLAQALGRNIPQGEDPGPIAYDDPATRRALEQLLQQAAGEALAELRAKFGGASDGVGRAFYQAVFEHIASNQALRDSSIQLLATERARAIVRYLEQHGVQPERVQTGRLAPVRAEDGPVSAQLQVAADDSPG